MQLKPGQVWKHYKGTPYRVLHLGRSSETDDMYDVVVYQNIEFPEKIWSQSKERFLGTEEYDGQTVPRFSFVSHN